MHGERCVEFPQQRQRKIAIVAIAVVEGKGGEAPRKIAFDQPLMQLVHGDDLDSLRAQVT